MLASIFLSDCQVSCLLHQTHNSAIEISRHFTVLESQPIKAGILCHSIICVFLTGVNCSDYTKKKMNETLYHVNGTGEPKTSMSNCGVYVSVADPEGGGGGVRHP